ncbi:MAG TPA: sulfatase-like hydrolase/transferase [Candidatus Saccharimonadales bacterium]|nr:sulfatase-like hydrolase/transferase [Candidatus Saccharimonadales bacterium]
MGHKKSKKRPVKTPAPTATQKAAVEAEIIVKVPAEAPAEAVAAPAPAAQKAWPVFVMRAKRFGRALGRFVLGSSVPEILLLTSLILSRWLQNSDFSYPAEIFAPIVLLGVLATIIFYLYKLVLRRSMEAHAAALPLVYAVYAYSYAFPRFHQWADKLVPKHFDTPFTHSLITVLLMATIFGLGGFALGLLVRWIKPLQAVPILKIGVFVVAFVFAAQLVKTGERMWALRHQLSYNAPASLVPAKPANAKPAAKPNVYYLLFDRYASADTLTKDYNFDNSDLLNFLGGEGFVTRAQAYANYPFTMQSTSSTLSMSYFPELNQLFAHDGGSWQSAFPYRALLNNPAIAQTLKQNGYTYNQVASWWDFTRDGIQADNQPTKDFRLRVFGLTFWMTDLQRDIINKSVLSPFLKKGVMIGSRAIVKYDRDTAPRDNFEQQMAALKSIAANSSAQKAPQFTFAHVLVPHDPYIFSADGSDPAYDGDRDDGGADETVKYTNQLTYLNTRIKDLISDIRAKDPNAAIVIQADEGPYPKQFRGTLTPGHYYNPINLPVQQMQQKFGVLASYYMPGADPQTVAADVDSSVNVFRFVLDQYLGYDLPMLPDCQFATGDKYQLYGYQLVSGTLKGTAEPEACKQYR